MDLGQDKELAPPRTSDAAGITGSLSPVPGVSRSTSPADSEGSTSSRSSRKRDRQDDDVHTQLLKKPAPRKPSLASIADGIAAMTVILASHSELLKVLPSMQSTLEGVSSDVASLKATTGKLTATTDALSTETARLSKENTDLKAALGKLEARVEQIAVAGPSGTSNASTVSRLTTAFNANALHVQRSLSQQQSNNEITISGFTFADPAVTVLRGIIPVIAAALRVEMNNDDIVGARLLRKKPADQSTGTLIPNAIAPQPVKTTFAAVLSNSSIAKRLLARKRQHGELKFSSLDKTQLANIELPEQPVDFTIHVSELLPSHVFKLLTSAKPPLRGAGFKHIWSRGNTVLAKKDNDGIIHTINSLEDIPKLISLYSTPQL